MAVSETVLRERYKIIKEISRGGMGVVYLAKDLLKNCEVAVKKSFFSGEEKAAQGFEIEAKLLARLEHPGLPKVLDYFILENNVQTLVMDFIVGATLEEVLESGKSRIGRGLDSAMVSDWAIQILDILRYLHNFDPPVVHRDIKPNNIKLTAEGKIILLDFGLAKNSAVTVIGGMSGYSPIEQVHRTGTDPRSDIYALGTTLYHLLCDDYPFTAIDRFREIYGESVVTNPERQDAISFHPDPQKTVAEANPQVPLLISEIVAKAMSLMPKDRFQSAEEMKSAFLKISQPKKIAGGKTNFDAVKDWEKPKSLFDADEESLRNRQRQVNIENPNIEKVDSFISFVPEKIGYSEDEPMKTGKDVLNATVPSSPLLGSKASEITQPSLAVNLPKAVLPAEPISPQIPVFESNHLPRKVGKRIVPLALGGAAMLLLASLAALAWFLLSPDSAKTNRAETKNAEIPVSPQTEKETPKSSFKVATFRIEKNSSKTLLDENHQFAENERFKFAVTSPADGFLYIVSRNNQAKAVLAYPSQNQTDNFIKKNSESLFPRNDPFEFKANTPSESWAYFVIVTSREDDMATRIRKILGAEKEISVPDVRQLFADLDALANDLEKDNQGNTNSANEPIIRITKIQKKS